MSYVSVKTDDLTYKMFYDLKNFYNILPNLESAKTFEAWEVWFEKLCKIDKRSLFRYMCKNKDKYSDECIEFAEWYLKKKLEHKDSVLEDKFFKYVKKDVVLDFEIPQIMQSIMDEAELYDLFQNYGEYDCMIDVLDVECKNKYAAGIITQEQWDLIMYKYPPT